MGLSALQASQLASLLAGHSKLFTANNPGQQQFGDYLLRSAQSATMGLLAEEEEKKKKKKEKGLFGGKIGSALGTAAGIALAPATGGASLALAGAAGGALGGLAGQYISGGSPTFGSVAMDAAQGGLAGYTYGKAGEMADNVQTGATQPDVPASPTPAQKIETGIAKSMPDASVLSPPQGAMIPQGVYPGPLQSPGTAGVATAAPLAPQATSPMSLAGAPGAVANAKRPGFGSRFSSALSHVMQPQMPTAANRIYTMPNGTKVIY